MTVHDKAFLDQLAASLNKNCELSINLETGKLYWILDDKIIFKIAGKYYDQHHKADSRFFEDVMNRARFVRYSLAKFGVTATIEENYRQEGPAYTGTSTAPMIGVVALEAIGRPIGFTANYGLKVSMNYSELENNKGRLGLEIRTPQEVFAR